MKKHKTIRELENKAKKDDINALFQLAQYYKEGEYVDKDVEQAELYFDKVLKLFQPQTLQISSIKLVDFRGIKNISIDFNNKDNSNLTVIIGNNGAGKTAILEAVKKSLSWIIKNIINQRDSGTGELIDELDINNSSEAGYASIVTKYTVISVFGCSLELSKAKKNIKSTRKGSYQEITQLAEIYKLANFRDTQFNFPIMAYYSIDRAGAITQKDTKPFNEISKKNSWDKFDGYNKALNGTADFELFFRWFKYLEDFSNATAKQNQKILTEIAKLQAELEGDLIKEMERQARLDSKAHDFLISFKQKNQQELSRLEKQIKQDPASKTIITVTQVISEFLPKFKNLRIQHKPLAMLMDKKGMPLNIQQLSQGEKSLLALVADIARRLVLLNPSLKDPLQGNGIVLIDEIDLHLHPKWQQSVIPSLRNTFSNIQFIFTTHSPQVLSTVNSQSIRKLKHEDEGGKTIAEIPDMQSQGVASMDVMAVQMDTDPVPDIKEAKMLSQYKAMIQENTHQIKGEKLRLQLNEHFGVNHPEILECDRLIRLMDMKAKLSENTRPKG